VAQAAVLFLAVSCACAQPGRRTFGGKVLEVHAPDGWFLMQGGASKKHPRVKILLDKKTAWSGVPLKGKPLQVGQPVQVLAVPVRDETFRALSVEVIDPSAKPGGNNQKNRDF